MDTINDYKSFLPYSCIFLDIHWKELASAAKECLFCFPDIDHRQLVEEICKIWTTQKNPNYVLPCLSVRTGLDLFLQIQNFPKGSDIIISAINIPDVVKVLHHHGLHVVSLDVSIDTTAPRLQLVERLITHKTVALLLSHIYGKIIEMGPFIEVAKKYNLFILEDCAEAFCGFDYIGHPESDVSLFSFGTIKYYTCLGGAIVKVKQKQIYEKMSKLHESYEMQPSRQYLRKILKTFLLYAALDCPRFIKPFNYLARQMNIDYKRIVVGMVRGFPNQLIKGIRFQPSVALLCTLRKRFKSFHPNEINLCRLKGEYVSSRLSERVTVVGTKAQINTYWLFPILVENPDNVVHLLNALGVQAYRSSTQLQCIEPDETSSIELDAIVSSYPHEARYLMDHVVYLPVNKTVPFFVLDRVCRAVNMATGDEESKPYLSSTLIKSKL